MATVLPSINTILPNFSPPSQSSIQDQNNLQEDVLSQDLKNNLMRAFCSVVMNQSNLNGLENGCASLLKNGCLSPQENDFGQLKEFLTRFPNDFIINQQTMSYTGLENNPFPLLQTSHGNYNVNDVEQRTFEGPSDDLSSLDYSTAETVHNLSVQSDAFSVPQVDCNSNKAATLQDYVGTQTDNNMLAIEQQLFEKQNEQKANHNTTENSLSSSESHQPHNTYHFLQMIPLSGANCLQNSQSVRSDNEISDDAARAAIVDMVDNFLEEMEMSQTNTTITLSEIHIEHQDLPNTEVNFDGKCISNVDETIEQNGENFTMETLSNCPSNTSLESVENVRDGQEDDNDISLSDLHSLQDLSPASSGYASDADLSPDLLDMPENDDKIG